MKRYTVLFVALLVILQSAVAAFAAPVPENGGKAAIVQIEKKEIPAWVYRGIYNLAAASVIALPPGGAEELSRDEMALLVARADRVMAAAEAKSVRVTSGDYQATLEAVGQTTQTLAKLEELERRTPAELARYQEEYQKAEQALDLWAERLATAEISASGSEGAEQVALKYKEALQQFGRVTKTLAQVETGRQERQAYIKQLKEQKATLLAQLHDDAQFLAADDLPIQKQQTPSYSEGLKKEVRDLKVEFAEESRRMNDKGNETAIR